MALQASKSPIRVQARDLNAVEKGIRKYQYNASGAVKKGESHPASVAHG